MLSRERQSRHLEFFLRDRWNPSSSRWLRHRNESSVAAVRLSLQLLESYLWLRTGVHLGYFPKDLSAIAPALSMPNQAYQVMLDLAYKVATTQGKEITAKAPSFAKLLDVYASNQWYFVQDVEREYQGEPESILTLFQSAFLLSANIDADDATWLATDTLFLVSNSEFERVLREYSSQYSQPNTIDRSSSFSALFVSGSDLLHIGVCRVLDHLYTFRRMLIEGGHFDWPWARNDLTRRILDIQEWRLNLATPVTSQRLLKLLSVGLGCSLDDCRERVYPTLENLIS